MKILNSESIKCALLSAYMQKCTSVCLDIEYRKKWVAKEAIGAVNKSVLKQSVC